VTCRELSDFLHDFVAGELAPEVLAEFDRHLAACHNCGIFLAQYRETVVLGRVVSEGPLPAIPEDLVKAVLETLKK
jgi:anti-sigma factor RsiW